MKNDNININYEMKNDWLFLDNHTDKTVYCPVCGKNLKDSIFTDKGYGESISSGSHCNNCNINIYTYKVVKCK